MICWKLPRKRGCLVFGTIAWGIGMGTVLSFNALKDYSPLSMFAVFDGMTIYGLIDFFTANFLMPVGGILIAVFAGWMIRKEIIDEHVEFSSPLMKMTWIWLMRVVAPLAIIGILVQSLA